MTREQREEAMRQVWLAAQKDISDAERAEAHRAVRVSLPIALCSLEQAEARAVQAEAVLRDLLDEIGRPGESRADYLARKALEPATTVDEKHAKMDALKARAGDVLALAAKETT